MKKIFLFVCLLVSAVVFGQRPVNYTKLNHRYNYVSQKSDSAQIIPGYNGAPVGMRVGEEIRSGYIAIDTLNSVLYFYSDSAWRTVTGTNIYNSNGTLTSNRTLTGDANSLTFTGLSSFLTAIGSTTRLSISSSNSSLQSPDAQNYFLTDDSSSTVATQNNYLTIKDVDVLLDTLARDPGIWDLRWNPTTKKITYSDTALLGGKLNISDTSNMLANYLVTASDLSPIFTTSESGQNITFNLSNTTQYTVLGRTASGSGVPSYVSIDTTFISNFYTKVRSLFSAGTGISIANGEITSTVTGGTVTEVTASDANGFDFTITDPTTAPNISLTTSVTNTRVIYSNSGAVAGISGVTSDGTNMTAGSGNLRATRPRITTSIDDANGNESLILTATGSAVNEFTVANAATGDDPTITASGGDSNVGFNLVTKGTGAWNFKGNSTQAAEIRLYEDTDNGTDYTSFKVGSQSYNIQYTLPTAYPGASGYALTSTDAGVMSWAAMGTVTSFAATDGNGFDFTVSNATTTPTLTATTTVSDTRVMYSSSGAITGSGQFTFTGQALQLASTNTTQATTSSAFAQTYNSLTTGTGQYISSSSLTTGNLLELVSTSTALSSNSSEGLNVDFSGANSNSGITTTGVRVTVANSGATSTNNGIRVSVSGAASSNNGIYTTASATATINRGGIFEATGSGASTNYGIQTNAGTGTGTNYGVYGQGSGSSATVNYGGYFIATGGGTSTNYGLYAEASNGTTNYAALLQGNVWVNGLNTTGTTTSSALYMPVNQLTSGTGQHITTNSLTSGTLLNIIGTSTALASGNEAVNISLSGANASSSITATGQRISVTNTGTSSTNLGLEITASGASTNYAARFLRGKVSIGTAGTETGNLEISGSASGTITIKPNNTAGTWTLELPANDGDANQVLKTDGSGVTSWAAVPRYTPQVVSTAAVTTSVTINADATDLYVITAQNSDFTFNAPTGTIAHGQKLIIRAKATGSSRTATWNSVFRGTTSLDPLDGSVKILTTYYRYWGFIYNSTDSKWDLVALHDMD